MLLVLGNFLEYLTLTTILPTRLCIAMKECSGHEGNEIDRYWKTRDS